MEKKAFVLLLILIFLIFVGNVFALERTRLYGKIDPNTKILLNIKYSVEGRIYEQTITKESDESGVWEYVMNSDINPINLKLTYKDKLKEFLVPVGGDFLASLEEKIEEVNLTENKTEVKENSNETVKEEKEEASPITGKSIFSDLQETEIKSLVVPLIVLFVVVVIANLVSEAILHLFRSFKNTEKKKPPIKVIKLSEKLSELKRKEEEVAGELAKAKRGI